MVARAKAAAVVTAAVALAIGIAVACGGSSGGTPGSGHEAEAEAEAEGEFDAGMDAMPDAMPPDGPVSLTCGEAIDCAGGCNGNLDCASACDMHCGPLCHDQIAALQRCVLCDNCGVPDRLRDRLACSGTPVDGPCHAGLNSAECTDCRRRVFCGAACATPCSACYHGECPRPADCGAESEAEAEAEGQADAGTDGAR